MLVVDGAATLCLRGLRSLRRIARQRHHTTMAAQRIPLPQQQQPERETPSHVQRVPAGRQRHQQQQRQRQQQRQQPQEQQLQEQRQEQRQEKEEEEMEKEEEEEE